MLDKNKGQICCPERTSGTGYCLNRPLPFKLHQSYRPLPRFIREFNPASQEMWSGPAEKCLVFSLVCTSEQTYTLFSLFEYCRFLKMLAVLAALCSKWKDLDDDCELVYVNDID